MNLFATPPTILIFIILRFAVLGGLIGLFIYLIYLVFTSPSMEQEISQRLSTIRSLYFYLASFVGLMMLVIGVAGVVNTILKATIFTRADNYTNFTADDECSPDQLKQTPSTTVEMCQNRVAQEQKAQEVNRAALEQSNLAYNVGLIIVGTPLFAYHVTHAARRRRKTA